MTLKLAIECVERKQMCNKKDIRDCYGKECDKCEYSVSHDAFIMALDVILAELDYDAYVIFYFRESYIDSEEELYRKLKKFKEEFNSSYGKLSRRERRKNGFRYAESE